MEPGMRTWPTRVGAVLQMLDPASGPRLVLERLWQEVVGWNTIGGIWLNCRPGHLQPAGTYLVGEPVGEAEEIASLATPATAPIHTDLLPVVARQLRDGNVPIATLLVSHHDAEDDGVQDRHREFLAVRARAGTDTSGSTRHETSDR